MIAALEEMGGEVWFRGEHQLGVVVPGLGDSLLLAMEKPGAAAFATLSTYGGPPASCRSTPPAGTAGGRS